MRHDTASVSAVRPRPCYSQPARIKRRSGLMRRFLIVTFAGLCGASLVAQAPPPNPTNKTGVIGLMHAIHSTNDVEKTLAFYQSVFALKGQVRGFDPKGPRILTNSPEATLRVAMTNLRGAFNFELTQFDTPGRQTN